MPIQVAIVARFDLSNFDADAEAFDEYVITTDDDYLDSPIDELGEAAAIQDLYEGDVAREPDE